MKIFPNCPKFWVSICLISLVFFGIFFEYHPSSEAQEIEPNLNLPQLVIFQENTFAPLSNPANPEPEVIKKLPVIITAYSSTPWQTDDDPYITASGTWVRDGVIANNYLPIGTKIRIPELFGDKIFVVEDRMSWEKGKYHIDIWFPDYWQALNFGVKKAYIEILES